MGDNEIDEITRKFWARWWDAPELDKPRILKELSFDGYLKDDLKAGFYCMLNSYFLDIFEYAVEVSTET